MVAAGPLRDEDDGDATIAGDFRTLLARDAAREAARAAGRAEAEALAAIAPALATLLEMRARGATFGANSPRRMVESLIGELDRMLAAQLNLVLHHPDLQQ